MDILEAEIPDVRQLKRVRLRAGELQALAQVRAILTLQAE